ncbi:MAG: TetR/AcrR family transcriptional regulator [Polyangia bacterium]
MARRSAGTTTPRKVPKQARSARLVDAILQAAVRVLEKDGAAAFTTIRVAARAGVSVGSLYQYFPNKGSILVRLQEDEWISTSQLVDGIFSDTSVRAPERLRKVLRAFFQSECDEAPLRHALDIMAPHFEPAPEVVKRRDRGRPLLVALIDEAAPGLDRRQLAFAAELYVSLMKSMGKQVSETVRSPAVVQSFADASADMFLAYLRDLPRR